MEWQLGHMAGARNFFVSKLIFRLAVPGNIVPFFAPLLGHAAVSPFGAVFFSVRCFFARRLFSLRIEFSSCCLWARCALFLLRFWDAQQCPPFLALFFRYAAFFFLGAFLSPRCFRLAFSGHFVPCFCSDTPCPFFFPRRFF